MQSCNTKKDRPVKRKIWTGIIVLLFCCLMFLIYLNTHIKTVDSPAVRSYWSRANYSTDRDSIINEYIKDGTGPLDRPKSIVIRFQPQEEEIEVQVNSEDKHEHERIIRTSGSSGEALIKNLCPNMKYSYTVRNVNKNRIIKKGWFFTAGHVRTLDIDKVYNVRDMGGLKTEDNGTIRFGKIIRGSELDGEHGIHISDKGKRELLDDLNIRFDLDLRNDDEVDMDEDQDTNKIIASALGTSVEYMRIPIKPYLTPWIDMEDQEKVSMGEEINQYFKVFSTIFQCVEEDIPIYLHCWGGADRTGTICFLLEGLLGVREEELAKDYELTSLAKKFGIRSKDSDEYQQMINYIGRNGDHLLKEQFDDFFIDLGFTEKELDLFRENMLTLRAN